MPLLFDHNPQTGITQYFDYDPVNDKIHIHNVQDVAEILDQCKAMRNETKSQKGKVETWAHYAKIPAIVEMQLRQKGLRLEDKSATHRIIREIETNYPYCKVTNKRHA